MVKVGDKVRTRKPFISENIPTSVFNSFDFEVTSIENGLLYNREEKIYAVDPKKVKLIKSAKKDWLDNDLQQKTKEVDVKPVVSDSTDVSKELEETVLSPSHYQLFPEFNLEVKDVNKRLLSKIENSDFDMNLFEAGWYQQAMQYFFRFYAKNDINDLEKGINSLQIMIDSYKERHKEKD